MTISKRLARGAKKYLQSRDGHIALTTAIIGIPLLLVSSVALDLNYASSKKTNIAAAIDAAALAAVIPANLTDSEREAFAKKVFEENYFGNLKVELDITAVRERVDIAAKSRVPTLLNSIAGKDYIKISEKTAAVVTISDIVCVLALDPTGSGALQFAKNAKFNAPACSVQVNSTGIGAMVSKSSYMPKAQSFCVGGTSKGSFNGALKHACTPVADPYAHITTPENGPCISLSKLTTKGFAAIDKAYLYPGTYCDGLDIKGVDITFAPGTYIFPKGKLRFRKGSQSVAHGVTFVLKGSTPFWMEDGASLELTAPSTGNFAGLAIYQTKSTHPGGPKSRIRSGSGVNFTGTVYLPDQRLEISSDSPVVSEAPATSFIAHNVLFTGEANVTVHVDHEKGGLPPILPRSDEGARLVK